MPDFSQGGAITTLHDLAHAEPSQLEQLLRKTADKRAIGLVLPVTAGDMRAEPFDQIVKALVDAD